MNKPKTALVKYVFLDIVGYTRNRSVEAQSDLISRLNTIVTTALENLEITTEHVILIPTGDGICIAIIQVTDPYDIHITLSLKILALIHDYNESTTDKMRQFQVRVGISENIDNLVTDVNGRLNVAGSGINMAQRIMNVANGGQVLVGQTVFEQLQAREKYMSRFRSYSAQVKYGIQLPVHQYIDGDAKGLNIETPEAFKRAKTPLTDVIAYYMAHAITNVEFFIEHKEDIYLRYVGPILLYFLAQDSVTRAKKTPYEGIQGEIRTWQDGEAPINETWDYYCTIDFSVLVELSHFIQDKHLRPFSDCFETVNIMTSDVFVNERGKERLQKERPDIWNEISTS